MKSWRGWVLGGLFVWILLVTWWALSPVSDTVPTGRVENVETSQIVETSQTVECDSALSGNAKSSGPLPVLPHGRAYQRTPCELPHKNNRIMFAIDVAVVLAAAVILVKTWKPSTDSSSLEDISAA